MIVHLQNAKKPGLLKRNPGPLRLLHCLFHLGTLFLLLFLFLISWQKNFDLLLYAAEPRFVAICERRVIRQCKLARIPDHTQFLVRKKGAGVLSTWNAAKSRFAPA